MLKLFFNWHFYCMFCHKSFSFSILMLPDATFYYSLTCTYTLWNEKLDCIYDKLFFLFFAFICLMICILYLFIVILIQVLYITFIYIILLLLLYLQDMDISIKFTKRKWERNGISEMFLFCIADTHTWESIYSWFCFR